MSLHNSLTLKTLLGSKVFSYFSKVFDDCCGGMSLDGNPDLVLNQQGNWVNSSGIIYHEVTYLQLTTLISNNQLEEGDFYLITNFKTRAIIQFTGDLPSGVGNELVQEGTLEPLLVQALSNNTLSNTAQSILYPQDKILYRLSPLQSDYDYQVPNSLGVIYYRQDQNVMVSREYDWRNIIFRRWETVIGNGIYASISPVVGASFVDYAPFENCPNIYNVNIANSLLPVISLGLPYILDNTVIKDFLIVLSSSLSAFGNTFIGISDSGKNAVFFGNNINNLTLFSIKTNAFSLNNGNLWTSVNFEGIDENSRFTNNTITQITSTDINGIDVNFNNNNLTTLDNCILDKCENNSGTAWTDIVCPYVFQNDINEFDTVEVEEVRNNILNNCANNINTTVKSKISFNTGNGYQNNTCFEISDNVVSIIDNCNNRENISGNIGDSIIGVSSDVVSINGNISTTIENISNVGSIINNNFNAALSYISGEGSLINNSGVNIGSLVLGGDIISCTGVNLNIVTTTANIQNCFINGYISSKTITPTANITSGISSIVVYDNGLTEYVEQVLTSGVVTYSAAITS